MNQWAVPEHLGIRAEMEERLLPLIQKLYNMHYLLWHFVPNSGIN